MPYAPGDQASCGNQHPGKRPRAVHHGWSMDSACLYTACSAETQARRPDGSHPPVGLLRRQEILKLEGNRGMLQAQSTVSNILFVFHVAFRRPVANHRDGCPSPTTSGVFFVKKNPSISITRYHVKTSRAVSDPCFVQTSIYSRYSSNHCTAWKKACSFANFSTFFDRSQRTEKPWTTPL